MGKLTISQEHTSKNLLIAGVKERNPHKENFKSEIEKLKEIFGVKEYYLDMIIP